jgi:hypothetical protein
LFKVCNLLVQVQVEWRYSCFDFEEPYRRSPVCPTHCLEALGLDGSKVTGNSLSLLLGRVVPHSSTISHSTTDDFCVYFSGTEEATPLHGHGEPSEGKLLGSELPFYSVKVALPLEFTVDLDTKKPGLLDWSDRLLAKVNSCRGYCIYTGKVDEFTLFWGKLYALCLSLLAIDLLDTFEVLVSL